MELATRLVKLRQELSQNILADAQVVMHAQTQQLRDSAIMDSVIKVGARLPEKIQEADATLVALTPQQPDHSAAMREKQALGFDLLWDRANAYTSQLGLVFKFPQELADIYTAFGIDLAKRNGDDSWTMPMPARIVVDRAGVVRAVDVDPDYMRRPEPGKTLADLAALA